MKYKLLSVFSVFLSWVFFSLNSNAAPVVSSIDGAATKGKIIIVYGTGFGTRGNFNEGGYAWSGHSPIVGKFKDFEDGSKTSGGWYDAFPAQNSITNGGRTPGGKYLTERYVSDERSQVQFSMSKTTGQFYVTFWFMMPPNTQSGKIWRIYGSGSSANIYLSAGCESYLLRGYSECTGPGCSPATEWGTGSGFTANTWQRVEIWMNQTTNTFTTHIDGAQQWTKSNWVGNPFVGNGHTMDFGNMIDGPERGCGTAGSYNYDDIYVDYTRARVELCSGSAWGSRGKCEIQIPTAWSSSGTSVSVAVNPGSFNANQQAYLYIVDSTGAANANGYPVTIGGTSTGPDAPLAPQGLKTIN